MSVSRRNLLSLGLGATAVAVAGSAQQFIPQSIVQAAPQTPSTGPAPDADVLALQRMAYGPSPEDLAKVRRMGLADYIDEQLNPTADDGPTVARLLSTLTFPLAVYIERGEAEASMSEMSEMEAMADLEAGGRLQGKGKGKGKGQPGNGRGNRTEKAAQLRKKQELKAQGERQYEQSDEPLTWWNAPLNERWRLLTEGTQQDRPLQRRPGQESRIVSVIRAMHSPWQLREVLVEFWHNHFNVDLEADRRIPVVFPDFDAAIRTHALGNFRDLLEVTATSPAMLYYLNNAASKASPANENYARELFELHTLGEANYLNRQYRHWDEVPGAESGQPIGYVDEDVYEAARAFTGWTVADGGGQGRRPRVAPGMQGFPNTGAFHYQAAWHDPYQKRVLGTAINPNQPPQADGQQVLDMLHRHPGTARYVCTKLVRRFIADEAPSEVVEAAVKTWTAKLHDPHQVREVVRTIVTHPRFSQGWGGKVKNPREFTLSYLRGIGAEFAPSPFLFRQWEQLGYRQFSYPAPTGHPDVAGFWLSTNGMLGRWNLLLAAMTPRFGATVDVASATPTSARDTFDVALTHWSDQLLGAQLPSSSRQSILAAVHAAAKQKNQQTDPYRFMTTLIAMTPEFQRR